MVKVLADKYLVNITDFLPPEIDLQLFDPHTLKGTIPDDTDALFIRTVTKINPRTFPSFPKNLRFIGTGSAGTDHVDITHIQNNGIAFTDAAGCNARSVGEYIGVVLILWADHNNIDLTGQSVGIIGVGNTGSQVQNILEAMGIKTVGYDPPRQERDSKFRSASLETVLQCPILTFHAPLTKKGAHPTFHWLDEEKLKNRTFKLVINAARGGIVDEQALLKAHQENKIGDYILDVWENEPLFNDTIAGHAFIKTPHIAGYSIQAKNNASKYIADAFIDYFSLSPPSGKPKYQANPVPIPATASSLSEILTFLHPVYEYQQQLMQLHGLAPEKKKKGFLDIRTRHPLRHELHTFAETGVLTARIPVLKPLFINNI